MTPPPRSSIVLRVLAAALVCAALTFPGFGKRAASADDAPLNKVVSTFKKALRSKDPKTRGRAFDLLRQVKVPEVVDHLTWGIKRVKEAGAKILAEQEEIETTYEKLFTKLQDANQEFETSNRTSKDMERYNRKARKISKALDSSVKELKNLENDGTRSRALLMQAVLVAGELLAALDGEPFEDAVARLGSQWLHAKGMDDRLRWFDAVGECVRPAITQALHGVAQDEAFETVLRVRAIDALAARRDGRMLGDAMDMLRLGKEHEALILAAIRALRTIHDKRAIPPLIAFLGRDDLKRARGDARIALTSLTGFDHGPYDVKWKSWWDESAKTFVMPKDPKPRGNVQAAEKGKTFYGIHTFSDKILFIVDISGSMDKQQKGDGAEGKTKFEVLQQELTGTVFNLNATDTFNVVFFNHQVIPWQTRKVAAGDRNKGLLKQWVMDQKPLGGTNIYDSLEMGFKIAHRVTGASNLDTIFFLTDGRPTAGKVRDPAVILELVKSWNVSAHLTIHCIGIGKDHDEDFLRKLAEIGDGTYMRR